jgi:hypothetical protein
VPPPRDGGLDPDPGPRLDRGDDRRCVGRPTQWIRGDEGDRAGTEGARGCGVRDEGLDEAVPGFEPQLAARVDDGAEAKRYRFVEQRHQPVAVDLCHDQVDRVGADIDGGADGHPAANR